MRSNEQNDCFHKWCAVIGAHLRANKVAISDESVKELCLIKLGNTREFYGVRVPMRSSKYKATEAELSPAERSAGIVSMSELLSMMDVWAAFDLDLKLVKDEVAA
jgi:hypothetical protein